ncbi:MAG: hypothetical protein AB7S42_09570, partial [Lysobacteraceae bacterium]
MNRMHLKTSLMAAAITFASALSGLSQAAPAAGTVDLLTTPPELTTKVAPNVVLTFDDSGSMVRAHMPDQRPYDGSSWSTSARWYCAAVIDPQAAAGTLNALPMNGMYYNPNTTYRPPLYENGASFDDASFTAAWLEGIQHNRPGGTASSTSNLSTRSFCGKTGAGYYRYTGPALTADASGKISNTGTLYTSSNWTWVPLPAAEQQNFANWFSYYRYRKIAAISGTSHAFADFDHGIRVAWQNINSNTTANPFVAGGTTILSPFQGATRTKFYNWLFNNPASGGTPNQAAANRVGTLFTYGNNSNRLTPKNPYYDPDSGRELACRK